MELSDQTLLGFVIALGIGLLIGIDRERRKGEGPTRAAAILQQIFAVPTC